MVSAEEASKIILSQIEPLDSEAVPLRDSPGRYLSAPVVAPVSLPPFDHAAMDGFAIRSGDTQGASRETPTILKVIGTIAAGGSGNLSIREKQAVRIMTGAPIPAGADSVVPFEKIPPVPPLSKGGEGGFSKINITNPIAKDDNIRHRGEDVAEGEEVFQAGEKITPRTIALLAALGQATVRVVRRPRITLLGTGSELVEPGERLGPGKIYNSNVPALTAALREIGIEPAATMTSSDAEGELADKIRRGLNSEVFITVGAVSAGDFDRVPAILKQEGAEILFHKVAVKPGKPLLFARRGSCLIFGLPGNPVSSLTVFERFVRPALLKMIGSTNPLPTFRKAIAAEPLRGTDGREDYLRGIVEWQEGRWIARSAGRQGSASLKPLARANALLIIPAGRETVPSGDEIEFTALGEGR